jgi:4-alpha-glucanotransferase
LPDVQKRILWNHLKRPAGGSDEVAFEMIRLAWSSPAALAVAPLQDLLNLGAEGRMNVPGRSDGNWRWRCSDEMLSAPVFERLRVWTEAARRPGVFRKLLLMRSAVRADQDLRASERESFDRETTR